MEIHRSAYKRGLGDGEIFHAIGHATTVIDLDPEADPPKVLAIGPDAAGNLLEVIWLELAGGSQLVIHAMALRPVFWDLLRGTREELR